MTLMVVDGVSSIELLASPAGTADTAGSERSVRAYRLGDGLVVRLSGVLDGQAVPELRRELLAPVADGCADVLVDAGAVAAVDDEVLAVLLAGSFWARDAGCRFALTAASPAVRASIAELAIGAALPMLGNAG
ncbi:MAG: anti-sigma factor antagonist [Frankiaceae bacterium]|jgi:anti-anti-sigma regulatory factor|nr:anti-sigma factor antagonist [Frankiaceae bacterium]MDQ1650331.1 anti-sigma factor antagonist [Frankiaceae bacterium]